MTDISDYGIKVVKGGKDVGTTDIRDFILHSDYPMFKMGTTVAGSITLSAGQRYGTVDINHNLGYVPTFLVYEDGQLFPKDIASYSGTSSVRIIKDYGSTYGQTTTEYQSSEIWAVQLPITGDPWVIAGEALSSSDSALRFTNITLNQGQSIVSAAFEYKSVRTFGSADIKFKCYGIDEDNTGDFGSDPLGRPQTDAYTDKTQSQIGGAFNFGDTWTSIVQEIINRPGWSSGNAMGFFFRDNSSPNDCFMYINHSDLIQSNIVLSITVNTRDPITYNYKVVCFKDKII